MMEISAFVALVAAVVFGVGTQIISDGVLRREYEVAHDEWVKDGSEIGYNWFPPGTPFVRKFTRIPGRQATKWFYKTPEWALPFPEIVFRIRLFRLLAAGFWISAIAFSVLVWLARRGV